MSRTEKSMRRVTSIGEANLAEVSAMRDRAANRVDRLVADDQVEIGAVGTEGIIAGQTELRAGLPPAVLPAHHVRLERLIEPSTRPHAPFGRLDPYPVAGDDAALGGGRRMQLDLRIGSAPPETWQPAMLALAEERALGAGQDQGEPLDE